MCAFPRHCSRFFLLVFFIYNLVLTWEQASSSGGDYTYTSSIPFSPSHFLTFRYQYYCFNICIFYSFIYYLYFSIPYELLASTLRHLLSTRQKTPLALQRATHVALLSGKAIMAMNVDVNSFYPKPNPLTYMHTWHAIQGSLPTSSALHPSHCFHPFPYSDTIPNPQLNFDPGIESSRVCAVALYLRKCGGE